MCNYLIAAAGLSLPVVDALGEEQVIQRALNLLPDFPDLKLYKDCGGRYNQVADFLRQKQRSRRQPLRELIKIRQAPYIAAFA